jgi:CheY-like chemotaxis protein
VAAPAPAALARLRADFIASVSHELQTPVALVMAYAETLLRGRDHGPAERARFLGVILRETGRLSRLIENVLRFSELERGAPRLAPQRVPLVAFVRAVADDLGPLAAARGARLAVDGDASVAASVDADALRQVLFNVVDNALRYGPSGQTIRVAADWHRAATPDGAAGSPPRADRMAQLVVDDEGPGIAPGDRERAFGRFVRLGQAALGDASGQAPAPRPGGGIGLAVVRDLVEHSGGTVALDCGPGRRRAGAHPAAARGPDAERAAAVRHRTLAPVGREERGRARTDGTSAAGVDPNGERVLRATREGSAVAEGATAAASATSQERADDPCTRRARPVPAAQGTAPGGVARRVLLVEDDADYAFVLDRNLTAEGYAVTTAADGRAAVQLACSAPPAAVVLDLMLPKLDGYGVLTALRGPGSTCPCSCSPRAGRRRTRCWASASARTTT